MFDAKANSVKGPFRPPYLTALVYIASSTRKFFLFLSHACNFLDQSYELLLSLFFFPAWTVSDDGTCPCFPLRPDLDIGTPCFLL